MQRPIPVEIDLYRVLGLSESADAAAIKRAWRRLAAECHPDVQHQTSLRDISTTGARSDSPPQDFPSVADRFLGIQEAYSILGNPTLRRAYDQGRREWFQRQRDGLEPTATEALLSPILPEIKSLPGVGKRHFHAIWTRWRVTVYSAASYGILQLFRVMLPLRDLVRIRVLATAVLFVLTMLILHLLEPSAPQQAEPLLALAEESIPAITNSEEAMLSIPAPSSLQTVLTSMGDTTMAEQHQRKESKRLTDANTGTNERNMLVRDTFVRPTPPKFKDSMRPLGSSSFAAKPDNKPIFDAKSQPTVARADSDDVTAEPERFTTTIGESADFSHVRFKADAPTSTSPKPTGLGPWNQRWLAGCLSKERIFLGELDLHAPRSQFAWKAWDEQSPSRVILATPSPHPSEDVVEIGLHLAGVSFPRNDASTSPVATLSRSAGSARLRFVRSADLNLPCGEWHLLALEPKAQLVGRWLLPDQKQRTEKTEPAREGALPLKYLELRLNSRKHHLQGHMASRYDVGSLSILPLVEFSFTARMQNFAGVFRWESPVHGQGFLTVAPVSEHQLAIRWEADELVPGKIQLTGGAAVLRRR